MGLDFGGATALLNLPPRTQDTEPPGLEDPKRNRNSDTDCFPRSLETWPSFTHLQDHAQTLSGGGSPFSFERQELLPLPPSPRASARLRCCDHPNCHANKLPRGLSGKESACQHRRLKFNPWVGKIPWRRKRPPTPASLPGESHGQRSLVGYSHGVTELEVTEQVSMHAHPPRKPSSGYPKGPRFPCSCLGA